MQISCLPIFSLFALGLPTASFIGKVPSIYIYKTVMFDRVFALYRPCAYPGAVIRHASGPTGPRSSESFFVDQILALRIVETTVLHKANQTPPNLEHVSFSQYRTGVLAEFLGSVCRYFEDLSGKTSFEIQPSTYRLFLKKPTYAVSTTNMSFSAKAGSPL